MPITLNLNTNKPSNEDFGTQCRRRRRRSPLPPCHTQHTPPPPQPQPPQPATPNQQPPTANPQAPAHPSAPSPTPFSFSSHPFSTPSLRFWPGLFVLWDLVALTFSKVRMNDICLPLVCRPSLLLLNSIPAQTGDPRAPERPWAASIAIRKHKVSGSVSVFLS